MTEADWISGVACARHEQEWCTYCRPRPAAELQNSPPQRSKQNIPRLTKRKPSTGDATRGKRERWTEEELTVLVAIYLSNDFSIGDDARPENQAMAHSFNRTPSAVDRQWRNLEDLRSGKEVLHVGENVRIALEKQLQDQHRWKLKAKEIDLRNSWNLSWLIH